MTQTYLVPLSACTRFLATQLSSELSKPHMLLPKHLLKPFLTEHSSITYINRISPMNPFERKHTFPLSSTRHLERLCRRRPGAAGEAETPGTHRPPLSSVILPGSQLTPVLCPDAQTVSFVPPPEMDLLIVNPHFGQIEEYMAKIAPFYTAEDKPRLWSAISTHTLSNAPCWGVEHRGIGELKISYVPFRGTPGSSDDTPRVADLIERSPLMTDILSTPTLLPQVETYSQSNILLVEQLIVEAALNPVLYNLASKPLDSDIPQLNTSQRLNETIFNIIKEAVDVLKHHPIITSLLASSPVMNSVLSKKRLLNLVLNLIYSGSVGPHLKSNRDLVESIDIVDKKNETNAALGEDKAGHVLRIRDPAKANRFIHKQGSKLNIQTPTNREICNLIEDRYTSAQSQ